MEGFGLKYLDAYDPTFNLDATNSPPNFILFFFVTTVVIYGIGIIQYTYAYLM